MTKTTRDIIGPRKLLVSPNITYLKEMGFEEWKAEPSDLDEFYGAIEDLDPSEEYLRLDREHTPDIFNREEILQELNSRKDMEKAFDDLNKVRWGGPEAMLNTQGDNQSYFIENCIDPQSCYLEAMEEKLKFGDLKTGWGWWPGSSKTMRTLPLNELIEGHLLYSLSEEFDYDNLQIEIKAYEKNEADLIVPSRSSSAWRLLTLDVDNSNPETFEIYSGEDGKYFLGTRDGKLDIFKEAKYEFSLGDIPKEDDEGKQYVKWMDMSRRGSWRPSGSKYYSEPNRIGNSEALRNYPEYITAQEVGGFLELMNEEEEIVINPYLYPKDELKDFYFKTGQRLFYPFSENDSGIAPKTIRDIMGINKVARDGLLSSLSLNATEYQNKSGDWIDLYEKNYEQFV